MMTLGASSHIRNNFTDPGVFAGIGIGLSDTLGVSASWTGETLDFGASILFRDIDWANITIEASDVTDRRNSRRISLNFNIFRLSLFGR